MAPPVLVIGNKNYSSWSLRPWLALRMAGIDFEEVRIPLYREDSKPAILRWSPSGKVPALVHGDLVVQESLAICEYAAELAPEAGLWPRDARARAVARAVSAEMHAGFATLRSRCPMNLRARSARIDVPPELRADVERVVAIWTQCRERFGAAGPFLFGDFTIADAMYAPVVTRFRSYAVADLPPVARAYADAVFGLPPMQEWIAAGVAEPECIPESDAVAAQGRAADA